MGNFIFGENVQDLSTFESDFEYLISYVKDKAPNASVYVIGDVWSYGDRDELKEKAAKEMNVTYISFDEIKDNPEYQAGLDTIVYDDNGASHTIEHNGVARHPGDKGMRYMADKILDVIYSE